MNSDDALESDASTQHGAQVRFSGHDREESLGFHGNRTRLAFYAALQRKLKGMGMSPMEYLALGHLFVVGPVSQMELADYMSIKGATSVRLIDRLVRDGWVVREPDSTDGRVRILVPTPAAREIWDRIRTLGSEVLEEAYQGIDTSEIESVKRVLAQVRKNLGEGL